MVPLDGEPAGAAHGEELHRVADRADGIGSFKEAVRYLKDGELVGIFPEATISRSFEIKEIKSGAVRIAAAAGVPVIPVVLWGTQRLMTKDHPRDFSRGKTIGIHVGEPMTVTRGKGAEQTAELHGRMSDLLSEEGAQEFLQLVPHAQMVDVSGAGHMVAGDRNDAFNDAVVSFLDTVRHG